MAICEWCNKDMLLVSGCDGNSVVDFGHEVATPIKYGEGDWAKDIDATRPCHDCNVTKGNYHHPGCDMEECPKCHGQLISCGCIEEEEDEEE